ncbi:hypothetical protein QN386_22340 [Pseudomonas sp. CCI3.2]|uniref:hypothetical protein n=1 Tax=unclassified Pseudomonas TaxID=196821 RepID=UPI002B22A1E1|nr:MULTISPECIES: hypothetical protein [unclassified Pseudomonas]MEB0078037.1 hypothetical protein [Pseudomonas sp. MH10out]MEB0104044.1 hypothetical protein [Pseudomonas sp. CCI3.2]
MTAAQLKTVAELSTTGFVITRHTGDMVRMKKGADERLVRTDGSQRRAGSGAQMNSKIGGVQSTLKTRAHGVNTDVKGGVQ